MSAPSASPMPVFSVPVRPDERISLRVHRGLDFGTSSLALAGQRGVLTERRAEMARSFDDVGPSRSRHTSGCDRSRRRLRVEVTMTDRPSPLDGRRIVDAAGHAVRDATVVVFPAIAPRSRRRTTSSPDSLVRGRSMARIASGTLFPATTSSLPSTNAAWGTGRARDFSRQSRRQPLLCALHQPSPDRQSQCHQNVGAIQATFESKIGVQRQLKRMRPSRDRCLSRCRACTGSSSVLPSVVRAQSTSETVVGVVDGLRRSGHGGEPPGGKAAEARNPGTQTS